jgi:predicted dehydrogenase
VGGKGSGDIAETSRNNVVVALCDIDERTLSKAAKRYPKAGVYRDWRKMLDRKDIDAVTVSTPDHMHAPVAMTAMAQRRHVYVQKPMAHTVKEARLMTEAARKYKVVSQMGNQGHSGTGYRSLVQLVRSGVIGKIKETHTWSNRPIWPQGIDRPDGEDPVPDYLHWDLWIGVAPFRPYVGARGGRGSRGVYHPFNWRGWLDFGVGALGDMGCHIIDPVVWSLELRAPSLIWYEGPPSNGETYPKYEEIHYEFPATKYTTGKLRMTWHDGGKKPDSSKVPLSEEASGENSGEKRRRSRRGGIPGNGSLFIGEKGTILCPHGGFPVLLPEDRFADVKIEKVSGDNHYQQWANACKGKGKATSHFDYSGSLTETVLLGTVAMRLPGKKLEWDGVALEFKNDSQPDRYIHKTYRKGWEVPGLV